MQRRITISDENNQSGKNHGCMWRRGLRAAVVAVGCAAILFYGSFGSPAVGGWKPKLPKALELSGLVGVDRVALEGNRLTVKVHFDAEVKVYGTLQLRMTSQCGITPVYVLAFRAYGRSGNPAITSPPGEKMVTGE